MEYKIRVDLKAVWKACWSFRSVVDLIYMTTWIYWCWEFIAQARPTDVDSWEGGGGDLTSTCILESRDLYSGHAKSPAQVLFVIKPKYSVNDLNLVQRILRTVQRFFKFFPGCRVKLLCPTVSSNMVVTGEVISSHVWKHLQQQSGCSNLYYEGFKIKLPTSYG